MRTLFRQLWQDDGGAVQTTEWVFVATILVLGAITGMIVVRQVSPSPCDDPPPVVRGLK